MSGEKESPLDELEKAPLDELEKEPTISDQPEGGPAQISGSFFTFSQLSPIIIVVC